MYYAQVKQYYLPIGCLCNMEKKNENWEDKNNQTCSPGRG